MKYAIVVISFFLDGIFSNIFPINSVFYPLFTLMSLIIAYPYYSDNNTYYKFVFFMGALYDLIYTDTFIFYAFVFLLVSMIIAKLSVWLADNYLSLMIITLISITFFKSISYLLMVITGNMKFSFDILFKSIYSSLIVNIIFVIILNITVTFISKRLGIRKSLRY